ncbi:MAG: glutaredoxin family protein [Planctomycetes bacterium]|nr:glutaredoxin family protein [Planctomycetota bacterium]
MWPALAFGLCVLGTLALWSGTRPIEWAPSRPGRRFDSLVLYTRQSCHLCDEAKALLRKHAEYLPPLEEVDVDESPDLVAQYGDCVPVVVIDGKVRFRGRIDETLLRRLIEGTAPKPEHQETAGS